MIAALIMGRKGSVGFPGKNTMPVMGRPLCEYPLLAAKYAKQVDQIYVTTDDPQIAEIARRYDAHVIDRPARLASTEALGEDVYVHAAGYVREHAGTPDMFVLLMCNAPTILAGTIDDGVKALRDNAELDSAVTVSCYNMWSPLRARKETEEGLLRPFVPFESFGDPATLNCDRDSQGDVWFADMGCSVVRSHCLEHMESGLLPQKWMGQKIYPLKQWGGCDVDYEWQIPGVEFWLESHGFSSISLPYSK